MKLVVPSCNTIVMGNNDFLESRDFLLDMVAMMICLIDVASNCKLSISELKISHTIHCSVSIFPWIVLAQLWGFHSVYRGY